MWPEAAPKPDLGCGSQCECSVGLGGCGCGCGCGVGSGGCGAGCGWVVCGCVGVGAQGYVIDARRLARQQFRLGRNSFYAWRSARQCQGMLPRTAPRSLFSLINFLPHTVPRPALVA